jgi:hypothetical protein
LPQNIQKYKKNKNDDRKVKSKIEEASYGTHDDELGLKNKNDLPQTKLEVIQKQESLKKIIIQNGNKMEDLNNARNIMKTEPVSYREPKNSNGYIDLDKLY